MKLHVADQLQNQSELQRLQGLCQLQVLHLVRVLQRSPLQLLRHLLPSARFSFSERMYSLRPAASGAHRCQESRPHILCQVSGTLVIGVTGPGSTSGDASAQALQLVTITTVPVVAAAPAAEDSDMLHVVSGGALESVVLDPLASGSGSCLQACTTHSSASSFVDCASWDEPDPVVPVLPPFLWPATR